MSSTILRDEMKVIVFKKVDGTPVRLNPYNVLYSEEYEDKTVFFLVGGLHIERINSAQEEIKPFVKVLKTF